MDVNAGKLGFLIILIGIVFIGVMLKQQSTLKKKPPFVDYVIRKVTVTSIEENTNSVMYIVRTEDGDTYNIVSDCLLGGIMLNCVAFVAISGNEIKFCGT